MYPPEDARFFEAILCTLLAQANGPVTLRAQDIADYGNRYRFSVRADQAHETVTMTVLDQEARLAPPSHRLPKRRRLRGDQP